MKIWQWLMASLALMCAGCSLISVNTNIPFFFGYSFEVINNSPYYLDIAVRGQHQTFETDKGAISEMLAPGQTGTIGLKNFSGNTSAEATVSAKAWNQPTGGQLIGAASRRLSISGQYSQADTWIVGEQTFRFGY